MGEWLPIESAPKETWVLTGLTGCPHLFILRQDHNQLWWTQDAQPSVSGTHWMPLPEPPEQLMGQGGE